MCIRDSHRGEYAYNRSTSNDYPFGSIKRLDLYDKGAVSTPVSYTHLYTEDSLLSAMETAGNAEFDDDTEKKGLGTPATRAGRCV